MAVAGAFACGHRYACNAHVKNVERTIEEIDVVEHVTQGIVLVRNPTPASTHPDAAPTFRRRLRHSPALLSGRDPQRPRWAAFDLPADPPARDGVIGQALQTGARHARTGLPLSWRRCTSISSASRHPSLRSAALTHVPPSAARSCSTTLRDVRAARKSFRIGGG